MNRTRAGNKAGTGKKDTAAKTESTSTVSTQEAQKKLEGVLERFLVAKALKEGTPIETVADQYGLDESEVQARKEEFDEQEKELEEQEREGSPSYDGVFAILARSSLSLRQIIALTLLSTGATITEAARAASVRRETVHRWIREQFEFKAVKAAILRSLLQSTVDKLVVAADPAGDNVLKAVEKGDVAVSLKLLKGLGLLGGPPPAWRQTELGKREPRR